MGVLLRELSGVSLVWQQGEGSDGGKMNGTFNGLSLNNISSLKTTKEPSGFIRTSFRVPNQLLPKLEQILQLKAQTLLILSDQIIEGRIIQYSADIHSGYEITIEFRKDTKK